jgi:hypothetical protein
MMADGSAASDNLDWLAGQLLGGDLYVFVDNADGLFNAAELARIDDAIGGLDRLLLPYSVGVSRVEDRALANLVLDASWTSASGTAADGVLGSTTATGQVTLLEGWDWYAGPDPAAIGLGQYDFQTVVTHELGHALGLGHSADAASTMYASLPPGASRRALTEADLMVPDADDDSGPHALRAAPWLTTRRFAAPASPARITAVATVFAPVADPVFLPETIASEPAPRLAPAPWPHAGRPPRVTRPAERPSPARTWGVDRPVNSGDDARPADGPVYDVALEQLLTSPRRLGPRRPALS